MLLDRLGNELSSQCVVMDCFSGDLFHIEWIVYDYRTHKPLEVNIVLLDRLNGVTTRGSISLNSPPGFLNWELIREVDYVPF